MQRSDHRQDHHDTDPQVLAGRLNTGWILCEREPNPVRKQRLEEHWIALLHQYEAACGVALGNRYETKPAFSDLLKEAEGEGPA